MRAFPSVLLLILLFPSAPAQPAPTSLTPVRISHIKQVPLTVKIVGPTSKLLKLGPDSEEIVFLAPGSYYCLYHFDDPDEDTFTKSPRFTVKPWDGDVWKLWEVNASDLDRPDDSGDVYETRTVLKSSAAEFQNTQVKATPASVEDSDRRLSELTALVKLDKMFYAETPAQIQSQKRLVFGYVDRYVVNSLLPKLRAKGVKVNYAGLRGAEPVPKSGPLLVVSCTESESDKYSTDPDRPETGVSGVWISCDLTVTHPKFEENPIWKARPFGDNALFVLGNARNPKHLLHVNALQKLGDSFKAVVTDLVDWAPGAAGNSPPPLPPTSRPANRRR
jgi:hypothetical protein